MMYQMASFHLDIIYSLYHYFTLQKMYQCESMNRKHILAVELPGNY